MEGNNIQIQIHYLLRDANIMNSEQTEDKLGPRHAWTKLY